MGSCHDRTALMGRSVLRQVLVVLSALCGTATRSGAANTLYISADRGVDVGNCSVNAPCATLAFGVVVAQAIPLGPHEHYLTIMMEQGLYKSNSCGGLSNVPLIVQGAGRDVCTIDCGGTAIGLVIIGVDFVISDVTIINGLANALHAGAAVSYSASDVVMASTQILIQRCRFSNCVTNLHDSSGGAVGVYISGFNASGLLVELDDVIITNSVSVAGTTLSRFVSCCVGDFQCRLCTYVCALQGEAVVACPCDTLSTTCTTLPSSRETAWC